MVYYFVRIIIVRIVDIVVLEVSDCESVVVCNVDRNFYYNSLVSVVSICICRRVISINFDVI